MGKFRSSDNRMVNGEWKVPTPILDVQKDMNLYLQKEKEREAETAQRRDAEDVSKFLTGKTAIDVLHLSHRVNSRCLTFGMLCR